jgi:hypothetical protein
MKRRTFVLAGSGSLLVSAATMGLGAATPTASLRAPEPIAQLRGLETGGLLAVGRSGTLWQWAKGGVAWTRLAAQIDPATPVASGHGRIAARDAQGGLWVRDSDGATVAGLIALAPAAGLLVLPTGIVGVVTGATGAHAARFEPDQKGRWVESSRCSDAVLPDARPLQVDLTSGTFNSGHIVVLAGPDDLRYRHGVLGDTTEATRVLYLDRHRLHVLRHLDLPAPYVIEEVAPRLVQWRGRNGLLTTRSGPQGSQLALIVASADRGDELAIAAVGAPIGTAHRWMSVTTDGVHWLAVHTPHIGGQLHEYYVDGTRLLARPLGGDVSNHGIGTRETDLAVWVGNRLVIPTQNRRALRCFDAGNAWHDCGTMALPGMLVGTSKVTLGKNRGVAALLEDGQVEFAAMDAFT